MTTKYLCTECSSTDVEVRGWIHLNANKTDISNAESPDDYWCNKCEKHVECIHRTFFSENESVLWKDPDGISSGIYIIVKKLTEDDKDSIYLIKNGFSEAEVPEHELASTQTSIFS